MDNVATYSEARSEYTKQLATFIIPALVTWFRNLWSRNAGDKQRCMSLFQTECEEISRWNQDRIHDEVRALIEKSGCDYMEELVTAVFVAHTKVLTAVRLSQKQKKLSITVPKLDHFIHHVFKESARCFWKSPFLFMDNGSAIERQKNILQAEALLTDAMTAAVRGLLPVKQILKDYMEEDQEEIEEEPVKPESRPEVVASTVSEPVSPSSPEKKVEEVKETIKEPVKEVVEEPVKESESIKEIESEKLHSILKTDSEPSVKFSNYETVFDDAKESPEIRQIKDFDDEISEGRLDIDEKSSTNIADADIEDLEPEIPIKAPVVDKIEDEEVVILE